MTLDIPDSLFERAERLARVRGVQLADVVGDALRDAVARSEPSDAETPPLRIEPFTGDGPQPGIDFSDNGRVQNALDDEVRDPATGELDLTRLR